MIYLKQPVTSQIIDTLRVNLSKLAPSQKLSTEPVCDFCGSPDGAWQYAAERMTNGEEIPCWRWLACQDCASAVDINAWHKIEVKLCDWLRGRFPNAPDNNLRMAARQALVSFHEDAVHHLDEGGITRCTAYRILLG